MQTNNFQIDLPIKKSFVFAKLLLIFFSEQWGWKAGCSDAGPGGQDAEQTESLQETDRGGRGDCCPQPC